VTIHASKVSDQSVKVGVTYGPVSTYIEEHPGHLRSFHTQLGQILDEIEAGANK